MNNNLPFWLGALIAVLIFGAICAYAFRLMYLM
jgi:hypothetical protein